jgi:nucleotide-binding universal stress UspA family protein
MPARTSMFRSVLVPLDGSSFAERALPLAASIARATRAKLRLVLVHQPPSAPADRGTARLATSVDLMLRKAERDYLRTRVGELREKSGGQIVGVTLPGPVVPTLLRYVSEIGADLVVMTTHGRGGIQRAWLGSIADQLLRSLEIPLILVPPAENESPAPADSAEILVALDGSRLAEGVIEPAAALGEALGVPLGLLQVVPPVAARGEAAFALPSRHDEGLTAMRRDEAKDYLTGVTERLRDQGLTAGSAAVVGAPVADTILEIARSRSVAMLAIATHGRGGLRRLILGSVADKLVRGTEKPVLVVRPRKVPARRGKP